MIKSMTGYGKGDAGNNKFSVEAEVRSVNSRYLDISLRLPSSMMDKENELRELIKDKIRRGKISVIIQIKKNGRENELPVLDEEKLADYLSLIKELKKSAGVDDPIKLEHLLNNKDLFSAETVEYTDEEFDLIKEAVSSAIANLENMKLNEGKELESDLLKRIQLINGNLDVIEKESSESVKEHFEKLKERIQVLIDNITEYSERLELELAIIADRSEITEECVRLRSHLKFFTETLNSESDQGRRLNFLCQEMNREANTISAKSISTVITHNAVQIKEEIEKMREQIQNIE